MAMQTLRLVLREIVITFGPSVIALLLEVQRQVQSLQEPDWRTLLALAIAQVITIIARFSTPPASVVAAERALMTDFKDPRVPSPPAAPATPPADGHL